MDITLRFWWKLGLYALGLFCSLSVVAQENEVRFSHLDIRDGLSNNQVNCIWKDQQGFMWFGTLSGLNRYDGYEFKVYQYDQEDSTSIADSYIADIFEDHQSNLWVETRQGLNIYDLEKDLFYRDVSAHLTPIGINTTDIVDIIKANDSTYWYISASRGVYRYQLQKQTVDHYLELLHSSPITSAAIDTAGYIWLVHMDGLLEKLDPDTANPVYSSQRISEYANHSMHDYQLMIDDDNELWFYVFQESSGLYNYQEKGDKLTHIHKDAKSVRLNTNIVHAVVQAEDGKIWVATDHGGINIIDKKTKRVEYVTHQAEQKNTLSLNSINTLYKEDNGTIWIGTYKRGIDFYHEDLFKFKLIRHNLQDPNSLPYDDINAILEDSEGYVWLGTNGGGLIRYNTTNGNYTHYKHKPNDPNSLSNDVIICLYEDSQQRLWVGTYHGGLNRLENGKFIKYLHDPQDPTSIADNKIWAIYEDSRGYMWIATSGGGLDMISRSGDSFIHYKAGDINSVHSDYQTSIAEDSLGNLWFGSAYGVDLYQPEHGRFIHYLPEENNKHSLSNYNVNQVFVDSKNQVWIGTRSGLNLYHRTNNNFRIFRVEDGLADNTILDIQEAEEGNYWISTPKGLSHLSFSDQDHYTADAEFSNYSEPDGLQDIEFNVTSSCKTSSGELIFGGPNGINLFYPDKISKNSCVPKVVLTDLKIINQSISPGEEKEERVVLEKSLNLSKEISLKAGEDMFTIEFAALNYFQPQNNQYKYQLEGFNDNWIQSGSNSRRATYTNLSPGSYTFKVMGSNNDGVWNPEPTSLIIHVLPPLWKTTEAFILYTLLLVATLLLIRKVLLERVKLRFMVDQKQQEARHLKEIDMMKTKFFTNISHEFRTPLSLIISPMEKIMMQESNEGQPSQLSLIHRNAKRLLNLVNQLLDFRKMEEQGHRFNPSEGDIVAFTRDLVYSFTDLSENKKIALRFHSEINELVTQFDKDKYEKILFNLLSNAFKFTPGNGKVEVYLGLETSGDDAQKLSIQVKDDGIGIPKHRHEDIFKKFFQNELPGTFINQGSGIGLSITQEFVKIHGGTIEVESESAKGACFTVRLPLHSVSSSAKLLKNESDQDVVLSEQELEQELKNDTHDKPLILLVEDHEDFRFYLKDNFKHTYRILEASHGKEAWPLIKRHVPDLIVSDVMMPEMNGLELCSKIKKDNRTSHIPVVLLTAKTADHQKVEGFSVGADEYVSKPFNFEILASRIKNLIAQRELLKASMLGKAEIEPEKIAISSVDEKLMKNAVKVVEDNMSNSEFSVEELSRELGMSRVYLYKKLLALTGKTPIEFIRIIRLKRASQLLKESQMTVAEVAYEVGFNNPKYFSKYFKLEFNILPSQYASQQE